MFNNPLSLLLLSAGLGLALSGCGESPPDSAGTPAAPVYLSDGTLIPNGDWRAATPETGRTWVAYYDQDRALWLRDPGGNERRVDEKEAGQAPSGLALTVQGDRARIAWRDKAPVKGLFVLDTGAAEPVEVSQETEALARIQLHPGASGTHVLWYGEKVYEATGSNYNLHYTFMDEGGQVQDQQWLMPGFYPVGLADGDAFAAFSWVTAGPEGPHVAMRRRGAESAMFGPALVLDRGVDNLAPILLAERSGDRWVVLWITVERNGQTGLSVDGVSSADAGATWQTFTIPGLRGFDPATLSLAVEGDQVLLAAAGRWRVGDGLAEPADKVLLVRSPDGGATWGDPVAMRDTTGPEAKAGKAHLVRGPQAGEVYVVWEDWRQIRPRVFGAYSRDFGKTFEWRDLPVSPSQFGSVGLGLVPVALDRGNPVRIVADQYTSDRYDGVRLVALDLDSERVLRGEPMPAAFADHDRLKARAVAYWDAMAKADYERTYPLLDPLMRQVWSQPDYAMRLGRIVYREPEVLDVQVHGHLAEVKLRVNAEVPAFEFRGKTLQVPERTIELVDRWLFVDGDWYREYNEEGSGVRFTSYRP